MIKELILLTCVICFIIDVSGFIDEFKIFAFRFIYGNTVKYREFSIKPFDCSLCATWWCTLIYAFIFDSITIQNIAICGVLSMLAEPIGQSLMLLRDILLKIIDFIYSKI